MTSGPLFDTSFNERPDESASNLEHIYRDGQQENRIRVEKEKK